MFLTRAINAPQWSGVIALMRWIAAAVVLLGAVAVGAPSPLTSPAWAGAEVNGVEVDPGARVRPALLSQALAALAAHPGARRDRMAVADFAADSATPRLFLIDLKTGAVEAYRTAHGKGSDPAHGGIAVNFSNKPGANATSLGVYETGERYYGAHGLSLFLDGLDETNSNARARAIVLHSASYMTADFIRRFGRPGRSLGCFVVAPDEVEHVVQWLEGGVLLYAGR
jgi:L,D-transpeptidase catalytic domain